MLPDDMMAVLGLHMTLEGWIQSLFVYSVSQMAKKKSDMAKKNLEIFA